MPVNRILEREHEIGVQAEATYGLDPGAIGTTAFFKHTTGPDAVQRVIARYDRDQDNDYQQASVLSTQKGRESTTIKLEADLIPAGAATPTAPDIKALLKACFGQEHVATAHTTTAAGSSGTTLNLAGGGGAASGILAFDMIAVDIDGAGTYEARMVVSIATDVVTIDRAFTSNPAAGRAVKTGATYRPLNTAALSVYLKRFLNAATLRYAVPGVIVPDFTLSIDNAQGTPVGKVAFAGRGMAELVHTDARPSIVTVGQPLVPTDSRVWFGATKLCIAGTAQLHFNNGLELAENESCSLQPNRAKRTGNGNGRYTADLAIGLLLTTGTEDTSALYSAAQAFTYQDVLVQLGKIPGTGTGGGIVAWRCPRFLPDPKLMSRNGEFGIDFGGGRCYGSAGDDEVVLGFI